MRRTTRLTALAAAIAVAAPISTMLTAGIAVANGPDGASAGGAFLPFSQVSRRCDFSETDFNGPTGFGRPTAVIRTDGSTVTADVQMNSAIPNMRYDVRLIQLPRSAAEPCVAGAPGIAAAPLHTDPRGAGAVTVSDTIQPGATRAWLWITRPDAFSQLPAEFYTTDFAATI